MKRKYELVYIVSPDAPDDQVSELHTQIDAIVQRMGGEIQKTETWGRRKLAYEIDNRTDGFYAVMEFTAGDRTLAELKRILRVSDDVLRHMIVKLPPSYAHRPLPEPTEATA